MEEARKRSKFLMQTDLPADPLHSIIAVILILVRSNFVQKLFLDLILFLIEGSILLDRPPVFRRGERSQSRSRERSHERQNRSGSRQRSGSRSRRSKSNHRH